MLDFLSDTFCKTYLGENLNTDANADACILCVIDKHAFKTYINCTCMPVLHIKYVVNAATVQ
jgi:hypothetical protein